MFHWTAKDLVMKGKRPCSAVEFYAYNGLELGMSLLKYDSIKSFWSKGCFIGHETFCDTMSRNRFESIRASARFTSFQTYDNEMAASDPLWSCRSFLDQIIRKSAAIAVPIGVSALDENRFVTKARSKAKTCSPNKPEKYAIHFYAIVGHQYCYLSSMFDNNAGNTMGMEGVHNYCRLFRTLLAYYFKVNSTYHRSLLGSSFHLSSTRVSLQQRNSTGIPLLLPARPLPSWRREY